jgi:hypothetical protein
MNTLRVSRETIHGRSLCLEGTSRSRCLLSYTEKLCYIVDVRLGH